VTHQRSQHAICEGVSGVTEEGCHPGVLVCLVSGTGSVFSFFRTESSVPEATQFQRCNLDKGCAFFLAWPSFF